MAERILKGVLVTAAAVALVVGVAAWSMRKPVVAKSGVGTDPGGVRSLRPLRPAAGNSLVGFSSGCFWGAENAFRKLPGVVATAVGYSGGTSTFPSYEVAHSTGHFETVLVEFNPNRTQFEHLLSVFWTLPRSQKPELTKPSKSAYQAAIWTYDPNELQQAEASRDAMQKSLHIKLAVKIQPARPFYLAEEYHQQYDEKAGKELCFASP